MRRASFASFVVAIAAVACSKDEAASPAADAGPDAAATPTPSTLPQTCTRGAKKADKPATCNGDAALCDRTFDKVVVPFAHNAMNAADDGFAAPNQTHGIPRMLADGIRGMMLDTYWYSVEDNANRTYHDDALTTVDQTYLCHTSCTFGKRRFLDAMCDVVSFLDQNPGEVVSIIFENHIDDKDTEEVLRASGAFEYAYAHAAGTPWPTLRTLVDSGKRLVVFLEQNGGAPPELMPAYEGEIWDTPYTFDQTSDFSCKLGRGVAGSPIYLVNHWLSRGGPSAANATIANTPEVLGGRYDQCTKEAGRKPTFLAVDYYDIGALFDVVKKANATP